MVFAVGMVEVGIASFSRSEAFSAELCRRISKCSALSPVGDGADRIGVAKRDICCSFETVEYVENVRNRWLKMWEIAGSKCGKYVETVETRLAQRNVAFVA